MRPQASNAAEATVQTKQTPNMVSAQKMTLKDEKARSNATASHRGATVIIQGSRCDTNSLSGVIETRAEGKGLI